MVPSVVVSAVEHDLAVSRIQRVVALSDARTLLRLSPSSLEETGKAAVVMLSYAHWEGYFNDCCSGFHRVAQEIVGDVLEETPVALLSALDSSFTSLRDRHLSPLSRLDLIKSVQSINARRRVVFSHKTSGARSNLDFEKLCEVLGMMDIGSGRLGDHRLFIDKELVKWRHELAHGSFPKMGSADIILHSRRVEKLMVILTELFYDRFQGIVYAAEGRKLR